MIVDRLQEIIRRNGFAILDGAMGTELERRGYRTTLPLWSGPANRDARHLIAAIHNEYVAAGSDILTANTFRTTRVTLEKTKQSAQFIDLTKAAVDLARNAADATSRNILVAGSLAPLEDCYTPSLVPSLNQIQDMYHEQIDLMLKCGVDFVLIETMINLDEVLIASSTCRAQEVPFMLSFTTQEGRLLDGTPLGVVIPTIAPTQPMAILLNCRPATGITSELEVLANLTDGLIGAYGNGPGNPDPETGWRIEEGGVESYTTEALKWYELGARIIGGCCGTTPEHIRSIAELRAALPTA